ncbi:MAG TPA: hypothetical protein GX700_06940 [Paracoccus sp.]|nr:hypothetical protein [Paracoccus sp. (in: a-proteobacteria)]
MTVLGRTPTMPWHFVIVGEGFRLFFALAALYAAAAPFLWLEIWQTQLPFAADLPLGVWHGSEMIIGALGGGADRLLPFIGWILALGTAAGVTRWGMAIADAALAHQALILTGLVFIGILGLATGRICVPVANHLLDPTEQTVPFRPHPGRMNLSPGPLTVLAAAAAGCGRALARSARDGTCPMAPRPGDPGRDRIRTPCVGTAQVSWWQYQERGRCPLWAFGPFTPRIFLNR